jgi:hypothetical protein
MLGEMNVRTGNTKIMKIIGTKGQSTINSNGRKLTDFSLFYNTIIMQSFSKHKDI